MNPNSQSIGLKINRTKLTLAVLISISIVFTVYTASAYYVASFVHEDNGRLWWSNTLGGSFYPWPYRLTGLAGQMLTELDLVDSQYYRYIIQSGVLVALTTLLWVIVFWRVWRMRGSYHSR
jgi:hypothetical protein